MWPDRVSNLGPLALESDVLPTALRSLALRWMGMLSGEATRLFHFLPSF